MKILDKAYWDNLVKLRDDMLNAYKKEIENAKKLERLEDIRIPNYFDYKALPSLSYEAKEKLIKIKPKSISQASRISGIKPSDVSVILVKLGR